VDKFFNTAGPVNPDDHYCLDPLTRIDLVDVLSLIAQKKYFVLHAPRQTGKTSCLLALQDYLNRRGTERCLYANVEAGQSARNDVAMGVRTILGELGLRAAAEPWAAELARVCTEAKAEEPGSAVSRVLTGWAESSDRPLVVLLDEVDALVGDTLISLLRQIRAGYDKRPAHFPQSILLCGVRDVRDYRLHVAGGEVITGGSAFNIKAKSLRLGDLTREETESLYGQHTAATGQAFASEALALAWDLTRGQPWLVNALAQEACFDMPAGRDRSRPVTAGMLEEAKENLILRRETHLDQLADKLREERVRRVVQPMLATGDLGDVSDDDVQYVVDLGLVRRGPAGPEIANPIYREVVPRQLTNVMQMNFEATQRPVWYVRSDGGIDMDKLLAAFQEFFRENSEAWLARFDYREAGPHLLMQAFLQRVVNGGGRIDREYALGRRRVDLLVRWPYGEGAGRREQKAAVELKVVRKSPQTTLAEGLEQTAAYAEASGADEAHLVIFDRASDRGWDAKVFRRVETVRARRISVWGM
jgi:hypothetical protein